MSASKPKPKKQRAKIYNGLFHNWRSLTDRFASNEPQPDEVIYAGYDLDGYAGSAFVLYRKGDRYYTVTGSHCSCNGLEGQWAPEKYTLRQAVIAFGKASYGAAFLEGKTRIMRVLTRRLRASVMYKKETPFSEHERGILRQVMQ